MTDFQQTALELAAEQQTPAWLAALRQQGASTWAAAAWPGRKTEHWKYISLAPLQQCEQLGWSSESDDVALDAVEQIELDAIRLVFVNGRFNAARSSALPAGVVRFADGAQRADRAVVRIATHALHSAAKPRAQTPYGSHQTQ